MKRNMEELRKKIKEVKEIPKLVSCGKCEKAYENK